MRITISGPPGSGKTTVCKKLSEALGLKAVVFGNVFRELAAEKHLTLSELGDLAEKDPAIDHDIDNRILDVARANEDIILESRLSAYMLSRNGIPAFKVYLYASPEIRMSRIGNREGSAVEVATKETLDRQASEAKRYMKYYGINVDDMSVYDLIVNTDGLDPDGVLNAILDAIGGRKC
jgi:predicted cytidylate kinase